MGVSHLAVPFRFVNGQAVTVEQDSEDDIAQSVLVLVTTPRGSRVEVPDYGVPSVLFKQSNVPVANDILGAVGRWEPRARVDVTSRIDSLDDLVRNISVRVKPTNVND